VVPPETNIVMIDITVPGIAPDQILELLAQDGILLVPFGPRRLRAVTHLQIDDEGVSRAVGALNQAMARLSVS
jgi:threonine aldolase